MPHHRHHIISYVLTPTVLKFTFRVLIWPDKCTTTYVSGTDYRKNEITQLDYCLHAIHLRVLIYAVTWIVLSPYSENVFQLFRSNTQKSKKIDYIYYYWSILNCYVCINLCQISSKNVQLLTKGKLWDITRNAYDSAFLSD